MGRVDDVEAVLFCMLEEVRFMVLCATRYLHV